MIHTPKVRGVEHHQIRQRFASIHGGVRAGLKPAPTALQRPPLPLGMDGVDDFKCDCRAPLWGWANIGCSICKDAAQCSRVRKEMAEALVRGIHLTYEVIGKTGPWIALTPGSRRAYHELVGLAKDIASDRYRVLLHDRRNCGASEVAFDGSASEHEVWADDLFALGQQLDALPMHVGGSSAGARLAILFAIRHPGAVRGLLLWRVTGGREAVDRLAEEYYGQYIRMARTGGMQAICDSEHFRACIEARPANRERLMRLDPKQFISIMTCWRERFLESASLPIVGATEDDLRSIPVPACVIAGNDVIHTPATAHKVAGLIRSSDFHDDVVEKRSDDHLLKDWDREEWKKAEGRLAHIFMDFLRRHQRLKASA
jgi:pimeloyl-ACP methyl ester carboxylesterase